MSHQDTIVVPPSKLAWYRPDIDGLRAIAVLSVVIFHAFPDLFPGGYTGVDVFFVISGFLISGIIFRGLDRGTFSFADFYSKRVRRIFPALFTVLLTCYAFGWVILLKDEFKQFGHHVFAGAGFASNFALWKEAGYFDAAADVKPLLHLWSLAIEEQFYLLFPFLFYFAHKKNWNRNFVVGFFVLLSFVLNIAFYSKYPTATFYNPATRFWEILLGSVLALIVEKLPKSEGRSGELRQSIIAALGLALIACGLFLATKKTPFPGWFALLPTVGAFLVIAAGMTSVFNRFFLANPIMKWFGNISYPLYLWHWPLLVFPRIVKSEVPSTETKIALLLLSVALSYVTFKLLENPLRFGGKNRSKVMVLSFAMLVVGLIGYRTYKTKGIPSREVSRENYEGSFTSIDYIEHTEWGCGIEPKEESMKYDRCQHDNRETPTIALLGDSKARALSHGLFRNTDAESRMMFIGGSSQYSAPVPIISDLPMYGPYQPMIKTATDAIVKNQAIKVVIITAATRAMYQLVNDVDLNDLPESPNQPYVIEGLDKVVAQFVEANKKVILTTDSPTLPHPQDCIYRKSSVDFINNIFDVKEINCSIPYKLQLQNSDKYRKALAEVERRHPGMVKIFDTLPILCNVEAGVCRSTNEGQLYYSNTDHISEYAGNKVGEKLIPFAKEFGQLSTKSF